MNYSVFSEAKFQIFSNQKSNNQQFGDRCKGRTNCLFAAPQHMWNVNICKWMRYEGMHLLENRRDNMRSDFECVAQRLMLRTLDEMISTVSANSTASFVLLRSQFHIINSVFFFIAAANVFCQLKAIPQMVFVRIYIWLRYSVATQTEIAIRPMRVSMMAMILPDFLRDRKCH